MLRPATIVPWARLAWLSGDACPTRMYLLELHCIRGALQQGLSPSTIKCIDEKVEAYEWKIKSS